MLSFTVTNEGNGFLTSIHSFNKTNRWTKQLTSAPTPRLIKVSVERIGMSGLSLTAWQLMGTHVVTEMSESS